MKTHDPMMQTGEDVPPLFQQHSPTSAAAAVAIAPGARALQVRVLNAITDAGGLTDEEGMLRTGLAGSTYRPRRIELVAAGKIKDSGRTRPGTSGRQMTVWTVPE